MTEELHFALQACSMAKDAPDLDALSALYRVHRGFVSRLVRRYGIAPSEHEDVVHDVFVALSEVLHKKRAETSERAFIAGVTRNVALEHKRQLFRRIRTSMAALWAAPESSGSGDGGASLDLSRLLGTLSLEHREVFVLAELEEMTAPEIASALGVPVGTVHSRLHFARKRLAELAQGEGGAE